MNLYGKAILGPLANAPAGVRNRMLETIVPPPVSLALTYATLLLVTLTAAGVSGLAWARAWAAVTLAIILWRFAYPRISRASAADTRLFNIIIGSMLLFVVFGLGCAASIASGDLALALMSLSGVLGIVAGLASRWAAVPRAAITTMALTALPPVLVLAAQGGPELAAAAVIAMLVVSVACFTQQNHGYLLAAITAEHENLRLAQTDPLTGLTNRVELERRLAQACASLGRPGTNDRFAVLYLDLDGFKAVNDAHGHAVGDELLRQVAERLQEIVDSGETIARVGGDEFVVLLRGADEATARAVADRIIGALTREHLLRDGRTVRVGCSAGVSLAPEQGHDPETLISGADAALYAAKHRGKGQSGLWRMVN